MYNNFRSDPAVYNMSKVVIDTEAPFIGEPQFYGSPNITIDASYKGGVKTF